MKYNSYQYGELALATIAWSQFLVLVAVVSKSDISFSFINAKNFAIIFYKPELMFQHPTKFGVLAILFNAISLGFISTPLSIFINAKDSDRTRTDFSLVNKCTEFAAVSWMLSFFFFLIYINSFIALATFIAAVLGIIATIINSRKIIKREKR